MTQDEELPDSLQFVRLLWRLDHAIATRSRRLLRSAGVTAEQRFAIKVLGMRPGSAPGQLARFLHVTPATVTRMVQRLEQAGLVRRELDPGDSRRIRLHLTAKGRRMDQKASEPGEFPVTQVLARSPRQRIEETRIFLTSLVEAIEGS